jgi:uncharacterized DUF497 family protein
MDHMTDFMEAPEVDRIDWDAWNLEQIAKHGITREQVEEVIISGDTIARASRKNRFLVLGPTQAGRRIYRQQKGGEQP